MMDFAVTFESNSLDETVAFGETHRVSDGGIDDAYADGYAKGHAQGTADGYAKGYDEGRTAGYAAGESAGYERGHASGYTEGETVGHAAGYTEGRTIGYAEGKTAGYSEGEAAGRVAGYNDGYAKGYEEGYEKGYSDGEAAGYTKGHSEGYAKGKTDGKTEGYTEGYEAGETVGYGNGYTKGQTAGYNTGKAEGYAEGKTDGYADGYEKGETAGYDSGVTDGKADGRAEVEASNALILTDINTALTEKGAETAETLQDVPQRIDSIEAGGGGADDICQYITKIPSFVNATFPTGYDLVLNFPQMNGGDDWSSKFSGTKGIRSLTVIAPNMNYAEVNMTTTFVDAQTVEIIDFSGINMTINNMASAFMRCYLLREIRGEFVIKSTANINAYSFYELRALEEIRFREGTIQKSVSFAQSPKLSAATRQSIVDGFADMTGKTAITLTVHPTVFAAFTDEQKAALSAKNVNLAS